MSENYIGPVLPPGFRLQNDEEIKLSDDESQESDGEITSEIGPVLELQPQGHSTGGSSEIYGPTLPPGASDGGSIIGPTLPPGFVKVNSGDRPDSEEDEVIGPLACEAASGDLEFDAAEDVEKRARRMKDKLLGLDAEEPVPQSREEWMTQLPTNLGRNLGLGPRTFSKRVAPSASEADRSDWTDTPADKAKKLRGEKPEPKKEPDQNALIEAARNREMTNELEEYNKEKRKESLLDLHKKKRKKAVRESSQSKVRAEFDREKDLGISRLDPLKAKRVIDGAKLLNGRFSHGSNHFL